MNLNIIRTNSISKLFITVLIVLFICSVLAQESSGLDEWVLAHISKDEKILCQAEKDKDYFFVSRSDDKIKTGYRINMTDSDGKSNSFIVSWGFKNTEGDYIGLSGEPKIDIEKFLQIGKLKYFEEVAYYYIDLDTLVIVDVAVGIRKYNTNSRVPSIKELEDSHLNEIIICENIMIAP